MTTYTQPHILEVKGKKKLIFSDRIQNSYRTVLRAYMLYIGDQLASLDKIDNFPDFYRKGVVEKKFKKCRALELYLRNI